MPIHIRTFSGDGAQLAGGSAYNRVPIQTYGSGGDGEGCGCIVLIIIAIIIFSVASHCTNNDSSDTTKTKKTESTTNNKTINNAKPNQLNPNKTKQENKYSQNFSQNIKSLLAAEESHEFENVYKHFSNKIKRYWDIKDPSINDIKKAYTYSWETKSKAKNHIKRIVMIDEYNYDLYTNYQYYSQKEKTFKIFNSQVRYIFDKNGKIEEVYGISVVRVQ